MARRTLKLWQFLLAGPFLIAAGIWEYLRLGHVETYRDRYGRTVFLYHLGGGRDTVLYLTIGLGLLYLWVVWKHLQLQREARRRAAEASAPPPPVEELVMPPRRAKPAPVVVAPPVAAVPADPLPVKAPPPPRAVSDSDEPSILR